LGELLETYFTNGLTLISVAERIDTQSAGGRMVLNILMSVAQWEREAIGERTREALAHKRNRGERLGGALPYGKRLAPDGIHLEDDPTEQRVIATIRRYRQRGLTIRAIVDRLKKRGVTSRNGRPLGVAQVHAVVKDGEA
jgi:DNA invertase Pin-like site-specific DNA recombinase